MKKLRKIEGREVRMVCLLLLFVLAGVESLRAQSYESLWKQVENYQKQKLPKSALKVVDGTLRAKALREGNRGQELAATLCASLLRQEVVPDSFFSDVRRLEARKQKAAPVERAVLASVLGQIYDQNRPRSQSSGHTIAAHPDSLHEWTVEQYDSARQANYLLSMADPAVLQQEKAAQWVPFVQAGKHAGYFKGDLLNVVARRAMFALAHSRRAVGGRDPKKAESVAGAALACYRRSGNREAELLFMLDSIALSSEEPVMPLWWGEVQEGDREAQVLASSECRTYERMRRSFADLPLVTEVYLRMMTLDVSPRRKEEWGREGLALHPDYERLSDLQNKVNALSCPQLTCSTYSVYYPGREYDLKLNGRNLKSLSVQTYRMNASFRRQAMYRSKNEADYVRRNGVLVNKFTHTFADRPAYETFDDTLKWTAPDAGLYVSIITPTAPAGPWKNSRSVCVIQPVSAFRFLNQDWPGDKIRGVVVDSKSGRPVERATVAVYTADNSRALYRQLTTDADGCVVIPRPDKPMSLMVKVEKGNDKMLPEEWIYGRPQYAKTENAPQKQYRLYTDRAIYRPGQEVQLGGIVFSQKDWAAQTLAGEEVKVTLYDANYKEVETRTLKSDEDGTVAASFRLPAGGLPGIYRIKAGTMTCTFRVEEYKRPTYQLTFKPFTDPYKAGDTITLRGEARMFSGAPVRRARLTGVWHWTFPYRWGGPSASPEFPIDTVYTDDQGAFRLPLPLSVDAEALRRGCTVVLQVEALSSGGETQTASYRLPMSTTPLRLESRIDEMQDRHALRPWIFRLLSPSNQPVEGMVEYALYDTRKVGKALLTGTVDARKPLVPEQLATLPAGRYRVQASARVKGDTASWTGTFLLFGVGDTRVPADTAAWFYCPSDTFSAQRPATICVGSVCRDVTLYYTLLSKDEVVKSQVLNFSNGVQTFTIPYEEKYGDGLTASFLFVKDEQAYTFEKQLKRELPDTRLRWRWTSFRDKLTPGGQEEWRLRLETPDGKPAKAHVLATLYDASLDPLVKHTWLLQLSKDHRLHDAYWRGARSLKDQLGYQSASFELLWKKVADLRFDEFDEALLNNFRFNAYTRGLLSTLRNVAVAAPSARKYKASGAHSEVLNVVEDCAEVETTEEVARAPMMAAAKLEGKIAGLDLAQRYGSEVGEAEETEAETLQPAGIPLRTNFNETAFFYPRLMADENGEVTMRFTLPESFTTWNFLGVAHTTDMMTAEIAAQATARKDFMARLLLPRFVRQGDEATVNVSLDNLSAEALNGQVRLEIFDPETEKVVYTAKEAIRLAAGNDTVCRFGGFVPSGEQTVLACRVMAECGDYTDGEQAWLPVLSSAEWVTETVELRIDSAGRTETDLTKLFGSDKNKNGRRVLTVEYTANPLWNAVQALPSLQEPQNEDVLSLASAYYSGTLAAHIARQNPTLQTVIEQWRQESKDGKTLWSNLQKNEELKGILLNETPWVTDAESEADRKARLATLFDVNTQTARSAAVLERLKTLQAEDGAFGWFPKMPGNEYMTREVAELLVRLRTLVDDREVTAQTAPILNRALDYLKAENRKRVAEMKKAEQRGGKIGFPDGASLHYLYIILRSGAELTEADRRDNQYLLRHMETNIGETDREQRALAAIVLKLAGKENSARRFMASLCENLSQSVAKGAYFEYPSGSFSSIDRKLAVHVLAMEAVDEVLPTEKGLKAEMRRWLLQQKRVQAWSTPVNSANAVYALLKGNGDALTSSTTDRVEIGFREGRRGSVQMHPVTGETGRAGGTAGLGYVKQTFTGAEMPGRPAVLAVDKSAGGEAWGAVYAQYMAPLSEVKVQATGLRIQREVSTTRPKVGDKLVQRYVITADRDYEYVRLKAGSAACMEPGKALSGYRYSDGLGYYQVVRDASTEYFFDRLPKGTYVLEHTTYVDRAGTYSAGLATLQCLYAPEYTSHTVEVKIYAKP